MAELRIYSSVAAYIHSLKNVPFIR